MTSFSEMLRIVHGNPYMSDRAKNALLAALDKGRLFCIFPDTSRPAMIANLIKDGMNPVLVAASDFTAMVHPGAEATAQELLDRVPEDCKLSQCVTVLPDEQFAALPNRRTRVSGT